LINYAKGGTQSSQDPQWTQNSHSATRTPQWIFPPQDGRAKRRPEAGVERELAYQEIWAWLITHHAITTLITQAATAAELDPDRISYTQTLRLSRTALRVFDHQETVIKEGREGTQ
jgi:hypothetical protein